MCQPSGGGSPATATSPQSATSTPQPPPDVAAAAATSGGGCGVLVALCGDVAVAGDPPPDGWHIRVTDDHRHDDRPGQTVTIIDGGLATSSVTVRRGDDGITQHLIDPATGR